MMYFKYFFLYISLLMFQLSSAHDKPNIPDTPIKTNNPPPTHTDSPNDDNPPTCTCNNSDKRNTPTSPPDNTNIPASPPDNTNTPTSPPGNTNTPTSPPGNINIPNTPPGDKDTPNSPPSDEDTPTTPPKDDKTHTTPPGDTKIPTTPPPIDAKTPTTPPIDTKTPTTPPSNNNNPTTPPSNTKTPTTPPSNNNNPTTPPSNTKTPTTPPSNNNNPTTPPSNTNNPTTPSSNTNEHISFKGCFSKVFAFGDSYTDTGNAQLLGGLKSFVGTLLSHFAGAKLPGYRQSNGRLMVDFLCEHLGLPYLPPVKMSSSNFSCGANFAVGGSTALASEFFNRHNMGHPLMWKGTPLGFQTQVDWFAKFRQDMECKGKNESACKAEMGNALFWIGDMGGNDYARILGSFRSPFSMGSLAETAVGQVSKFLSQLLEKGAKHIVVQGVPPIGCCPLQILLGKSSERDANGCSSIANAVIKTHNELLQKALIELRKRFINSTILYADVWGAFHHILENYKKYNFAEPFKACCGAGGGPLNFKLHSLCGSPGTSMCQDPASHIIWDGIHFTEAVHKHLTELILKGGFTSPISFEQLAKLKLGLITKAGLGLAGASLAGTIGAAGADWAAMLPKPFPIP